MTSVFNSVTRSSLLLLTLCGLSWFPSSHSQEILTQEKLCPNYEEVDPLQECQTVQSYAGLKRIIENAPAGSSLDLCPFFVQKVSSLAPILVQNGIQVICIRKQPDDFCAVNGMGHHLLIDSAEDTLWQGMSFRGSDDHAVYIAGDVENAEKASHTFCQSSFIKNVRAKDTRGGSFDGSTGCRCCQRGGKSLLGKLFSDLWGSNLFESKTAQCHQFCVCQKQSKRIWWSHIHFIRCESRGQR